MTKDATDPKAEETKASNFLRNIIEADLESGRQTGVVTRFPPEPNGYLHIGHAKSICLNFGLARDYNGRCHLRFDDTNPLAEDTEYVNSIQADVHWLGFDWGEHLYFASDYFEKMFAVAIGLIREGKAYVCSLTEDQIREYRGTVTEPGKPSPYRERSVEENLDLFRRMRAGEFKDGEHVLRARIDMASPNMKMRDPLLYRIRHAHHHRTGDDWCIYPMYDFAHCLEDAFESVTHSICTLEFENNRDIYDWLLDEAPEIPFRSRQYEFARLNLSYTIMSKRKLLLLVEKGLVSGWDDPRMPTIAGMRRRGYGPEAIRDFCERIGVAKANSLVDVTQLEFSVRNHLNTRVPRVMGVLNPLEVVIENWPEGEVEELDASLYPHDVPLEGSRILPMSGVIYIDRSDYNDAPPKGYYRLAPDREVRLRHGYIIKCNRVERDAEGEPIRLVCTYDPATKGVQPKDRKVKGTVHWVSRDHAVPAEIRLYDRLFSVPQPGSDPERDFIEDLNPDSLVTVQGLVEPAIAGDAPGTRYQFERTGFFISDPIDSKPGKPVFNRTVALRDSWGKSETPKKAEPSRKKATRVQEKKPAVKRNPAEDLNPEQLELFGHYTDKLGLSPEEAALIAGNQPVAALFADGLTITRNARSLAKWIVNDLLRALKDRPVDQLRFGGRQLASLIDLIDEGELSTAIGRKVFAFMMEKGGEPADIVEAEGLKQVTDSSALEAIIDRILAENPNETERFKAGEKKLTGFFVGQAMKATGGKADPKLVNQLLRQKLS